MHILISPKSDAIGENLLMAFILLLLLFFSPHLINSWWNVNFSLVDTIQNTVHVHIEEPPFLGPTKLRKVDHQSAKRGSLKRGIALHMCQERSSNLHDHAIPCFFRGFRDFFTFNLVFYVLDPQQCTHHKHNHIYTQVHKTYTCIVCVLMHLCVHVRACMCVYSVCSIW